MRPHVQLSLEPPAADQLDLFALTAHRCQDCGTTFETSRHATRCATCRSLHAGLVGPCEVVCPACDAPHRVPVLAPHRLCPACMGDLDVTAGRIQAALQAAELAFEAAVERLTADYDHADEQDQRRYQAALAARETLPPAKWATAWLRATEKGDGLSPLVQAKNSADAAGELLERLRRAACEVEEARG